MASLFLDTSHSIVLGLWEENGWLSYDASEGLASEELHSRISRMLDGFGMQARDCADLIAIVGPGSYTGVRVAKGILDVFAWQGLDVYSFRHFDVAPLIGYQRGTFVSNAFKKEVFIYQWDSDKNYKSKRLISKTDWDVESKRLSGESMKFFSSQPELFPGAISSYDLIYDHAKELFPLVKSKKLNYDIFYYRKIEEEFKKS